MEIQWWLVVGLSAFDFLVVSAACYLLRTHPPMGSRALYAVWAGMGVRQSSEQKSG
jgi:hypothetical protein